MVNNRTEVFRKLLEGKSFTRKGFTLKFEKVDVNNEFRLVIYAEVTSEKIDPTVSAYDFYLWLGNIVEKYSEMIFQNKYNLFYEPKILFFDGDEHRKLSIHEVLLSKDDLIRTKRKFENTLFKFYDDKIEINDLIFYTGGSDDIIVNVFLKNYKLLPDPNLNEELYKIVEDIILLDLDRNSPVSNEFYIEEIRFIDPSSSRFSR
jgi:hypothetical protein